MLLQLLSREKQNWSRTDVDNIRQMNGHDLSRREKCGREHPLTDNRTKKNR